MRKIRIIIILIFFLKITYCISQPANYNCGCNLTNNPQAGLKINGVIYYSSNASSPTIIPNIVLPLGVLSFSGNINIDQNVVCKPLVTGMPNYCVTTSAKTDIVIQNSNILPVSGNYFSGLSNNYLYVGGLQIGINTITVYSNCKSGISSGQNGESCALGAFRVNISTTQNTPFSANINNECHYRVNGPQHTAKYSGNKIFKIRFTSPPPLGTTIQIFKNNAYLETMALNQIALNTDYLFNNNNMGYSSGNYKIKFICNGNEIFPLGSTSTYQFTYNRTRVSCIALNLTNTNQTTTNTPIARIICSQNVACPSGMHCVNGICEF
ncbi:hypothetical protein [Flavobacterium sp.]|uniref:hypothetical protein n=1 Tax=Flavobacterium sp. TaxID=239 RepID=UPI0037521F40